MAKGKDAATLFEVINRKPMPPAPEMHRRPAGWAFWRKGRSAEEVAPAHAPAHSPALEPAPTAPPADDAAPAPATAPHAPVPPTLPRRHQGVVAAMDPDRQEIHLNLSYRTAIIGGFAVLMIVACAYMAGKKITPRRALGDVPAIDEVKSGPLHPDVIDPGPRRETGEVGGAERAPRTGNPPPPTWNDPQHPATLVVHDTNRMVGRTYIIPQSYKEEALAKEAAAFLTNNGVTCTVEKDLPAWASPGWYSVLGIDGFERQSDPAYKAQLAKIKQLNEKFAPRGGWRVFDPYPYTWGRQRRTN